MDDYMGIAAMSVGMHQAQAQQSMDVAVLKMALDTSSEAMEAVLDEALVSLEPELGNTVDVLA